MRINNVIVNIEIRKRNYYIKIGKYFSDTRQEKKYLINDI